MIVPSARTQPQRLGARGITLIVWALASAAVIYFNASRLRAILGFPASTDFKQFWAVANVFAEGGDVYDLRLLTEYCRTHGAGLLDPLPLFYPFFSFSALLPLSLLSFATAQWLYLASFLLLFLLVWLRRPLIELCIALRSGLPLWSTLTHVSIFLTFLPALMLWWDGGVTFVPLTALVLLFYASRQEVRMRWHFVQGLSLSLALVKPSVCFLLFCFLPLVWVRRREGMKIFGFFAGLLLLVIPPLLLTPSVQRLFVMHQMDGLLLWVTPTVNAMLQTSFGWPPHVRVFLAAPFVAGVVFYALRIKKETDELRVASLTLLPLGLVVVPYAWTYDFVVLLFPVSWLAARGGTSALYLLLFNLLLCVVPMAMALHWWYPLVVLLLSLRAQMSVRAGLKSDVRGMD